MQYIYDILETQFTTMRYPNIGILPILYYVGGKLFKKDSIILWVDYHREVNSTGKLDIYLDQLYMDITLGDRINLLLKWEIKYMNRRMKLIFPNKRDPFYSYTISLKGLILPPKV